MAKSAFSALAFSKETSIVWLLIFAFLPMVQHFAKDLVVHCFFHSVSSYLPNKEHFLVVYQKPGIARTLIRILHGLAEKYGRLN